MSGGLAPASSRSAFSRGIGSGGVVGSPPGITVSVDSRGGASSGAAANAGSAQGSARVHRPTLALSRPAGTAPPSSALAPASSAETWRGASPAAAAGSPAPDASDSAPVLAPARAPLLRSRYVRISEALLLATLVLVVATVGLLIWCVLARVRRAGRCSGTGSLEQTAVRCRERRAPLPCYFIMRPFSRRFAAGTLPSREARRSSLHGPCRASLSAAASPSLSMAFTCAWETRPSATSPSLARLGVSCPPGALPPALPLLLSPLARHAHAQLFSQAHNALRLPVTEVLRAHHRDCHHLLDRELACAALHRVSLGLRSPAASARSPASP